MLANQNRRTRTPNLLAAGLLLWLALLWLGAVLGLRVNVTPSAPLGLWRLVAADHPAIVGEYVFVCLPPGELLRGAIQRGYMRAGLCPGGGAPLIKLAAGRSGQMVDVTDVVTVDGQQLPHSVILHQDGQGRVLLHYSGGVIGNQQIYLHGDWPTSFDSRYFGPVPITAIEGIAVPVLVVPPTR